MAKRDIFMVLTSHSEMGNSGGKTGAWLEELVVPYHAFREAGFNPIFVSVKGGPVPLDPGSVRAQMLTPEGERFLANDDEMSLLRSTRSLQALKIDADCAAVFFVGGHGTMWDFHPNPMIADLIRACVAAGKPVSAVCHGVAALLNYDQFTQPGALKGLGVCGFSNKEEELVGAQSVVPFSLEDELAKAGANYSAAPPFESHVVVDGLFVTGQNPQSSLRTAHRLIELLG